MLSLRLGFFLAVFFVALPASQAFADEVLQYVSDKKTTMDVHISNAGEVTISGKGEFSVYNAKCKEVNKTTITCKGTGTRLKDSLKYNGEYTLVSYDDGQTVTSTWNVWYGNGEKYSGTTQLRLVSH